MRLYDVRYFASVWEWRVLGEPSHLFATLVSVKGRPCGVQQAGQVLVRARWCRALGCARIIVGGNSPVRMNCGTH
ncbi:hypothetical protein E2C01_074233 [Portunus trituberculatus]|uniref:Uncharacterized protein n=1 Tax=Portunus trituberculatus TaxID=210409 RepID=A0A5B7I7I0_PORTR|nr:hypothetical protein [Portunus trituberculatus]